MEINFFSFRADICRRMHGTELDDGVRGMVYEVELLFLSTEVLGPEEM